MKKKNCSVCLEWLDAESSDILTMGAYGTPKYLCADCAALLETATRGREVDAIVEAMDKLTKKLSDKNIDDRVTVQTVTEMFKEASERAAAIKDGSYDFSNDDLTEDEGFDEIPEELAETEEDRALDEMEMQQSKKFDKVMNWLWLGVFVLALAFIIWKVFF